MDKELSKGFTGIDINGVRFSNIREMLIYMDKQRYRIIDLEKENAELKEQRFSLRNERNTFLTQNEQYEKDLINSNENLTKAKEIIKKLKALYFSPVETKDDVKRQDEILAEVEQFLKDCEIEK